MNGSSKSSNLTQQKPQNLLVARLTGRWLHRVFREQRSWPNSFQQVCHCIPLANTSYITFKLELSVEKLITSPVRHYCQEAFRQAVERCHSYSRLMNIATQLAIADKTLSFVLTDTKHLQMRTIPTEIPNGIQLQTKHVL